MDTNLNKYSLKKQINVMVIITTIVTIVLVYLLNAFFLEKFYLIHKQKALKGVFDSLEEAVANENLYDAEFRESFVSLSENQGVACMVIRPDGRVMISTENDSTSITNHLYETLLGNIGNTIEKSELFSLIRYGDYLSLWGFLSDGNTVYMETPMQSIRDPLNVSNRFLIFAGLISLAIGILTSTILIKRVLKPLSELTGISERMSNLDFDVKYTPNKHPNEIDILGIRMNDMSGMIEENIKNLKQTNLELSTDLRLKEQNEEMRKEFISNVSHELKTPISLILGYAEGLVDDDVSPTVEQKKHYANVIADEAEKMDSMIGKLLELNELEYGKQQTEIKRVDITKIINDEVYSVLLLAKNADVIIENKISAQFYVWTDEFCARMVLNNYLTNAIRYCTNEKKVVIDLKESEKGLRLSVFNTGSGFNEEEKQRIWDKFYKADTARTREHNSTGIGLSVVKAVGESLGCDYGVENLPMGVEFYFIFDNKDIL